METHRDTLPDTSWHDPRCIPGEQVIATMIQCRRGAIEVFMAARRLDVSNETLEALRKHYQPKLLRAVK